MGTDATTELPSETVHGYDPHAIAGSRLISSVVKRIHGTSPHAWLTIYNRGGRAGEVCVNRSDADAIIAKLLELQ